MGDMESDPCGAWSGTRGERWIAQLGGLEATLRPVDEPLILALRLDGPARIADIGCGGGGGSIEVFKRAPAGTVLDGYDVALPMIEAARARTRDIGFHQADVATAEVRGAPYDRLVSRFGVMFFENPRAAFANLYGWLAPGGRFAFAVWGPTEDNPWMTNVRDAVSEVVELPTSDFDDVPGPFRYAQKDVLVRLLEGAGFCDVEVSSWRGLLLLGGGLAAREAAEFALSAFGSFAERLDEAGEGARRKALDDLSERLVRAEVSGRVAMNARVLIHSGRRGLRPRLSL